MLNLSITPLDTEHIEEVCEDIVDQQKTGVSTHAMFMMKLNPEGTPPVNKAELQCKKCDLFLERLSGRNVKCGVLVQATLGHIAVPDAPHPFQNVVSLSDGKEQPFQACPLDPDFRKFMKGQMRMVASRRPSVIMIDDDIGVLYRDSNGCACKYHMAEFNRRMKTSITRDELFARIMRNSDEDKEYEKTYIEVQRDALVGFVKTIRSGIDEIDSTIQGAVSGIYVTTFCEFSGEIARAFSGEGNPAIARMNGGPYARLGTKFFTQNLFRHAMLRENTKKDINVFLAETDTCPHNRYSTSASLLHAHFVAAILEGATGAKHWITRLYVHENASGHAYRKKLAEYSKFYSQLAEYVKTFRPFGCRIPLTLAQDYGLRRSRAEKESDALSPWSSCVLERLGIPLYFANEGEGVVFLDEFSVDGFSDNEIREFMKGTLVLDSLGAKKLNDRGFSYDVGVEVVDWSGKTISGECFDNNHMAPQYSVKQLRISRDGVEVLSSVMHDNKVTDTLEPLFPGVTRCANSYGGETVVFSGTPNAPFTYYTAFSMLNETRKKQLIEIISHRGNLPVFYPGDAEVYIRAGRLDTKEIMVAFFNLGFDILEQVTLSYHGEIKIVEKLNPDGSRSECRWFFDGKTLVVDEPVYTLNPVVLFIS